MNLGKETETTEFKESTSERQKALESVAAIINKHGYGTLYFGVKDNGDIKGQIVSDSTIKDLAEAIFRDIEPRIIPTIEVMEYDNKSVIKVGFSGTQVPYSAFGKFLIRVGTQNRKMSRDELIKMIKKHEYSSDWEKQAEYQVEDIDDATLQAFYYEAVNCGRLEMPVFNKKSLLSVLDVIKDDKVMNAAYALFGKGNPVSLKVACYATDEKITFLDLKEFKGNIYNLISEAMLYISKNIRWRVDIGARKRVEIPEIPIRAIREMVINAFAHANYQSSPEIEINIHPGKITIFNPGCFPDDLTPNDFIEKDLSSIKRNPLILSILFRCKDVEKSGTGYKRMNQLCEESDIEWNFENTAYGFYFEFIRPNVHADDRPNVRPDLISEGMTAYEATIYNAINENIKVQKAELAKAIGKGEKTVQRTLSSLIQRGYIKRIGNNQYGYWKIAKRQPLSEKAAKKSSKHMNDE
jgi:ATP-dependent DNA helicase RecG